MIIGSPLGLDSPCPHPNFTGYIIVWTVYLKMGIVICRAVATIGAWGARAPTNRDGPPPMIFILVKEQLISYS